MSNKQAPFVQVSGIQLNLQTYSGKGDELSFTRWYEACVEELAAFGFQNEEQAVLLMARQLKGNARQIYDAFKNGNEKGRIENLTTFKNLLEPEFIDDNHDIKLRYNLLNLKQTSSISKYIENEKDLYGNYKGMSDKDRIFYLMNNMKPTYLKILTKSNPKTYLEAISLLIQKGDVINMNAAMTGSKHSDDSMDVDAVEIDDYSSTIGVNLVSIDQRGKTFWVTVKEPKAPVPLNTSHQKRLHRNGQSLAEEAKIRPHTAGKSFTPGVRVLDTPGVNKFNQEFIGVEVDGGPSIPIMEKKFPQDPQKTSGKINFEENGGFKLKEMLNTNGELKAVEEIYPNEVPELDEVLNLNEELLSVESPSEQDLLSEEGLPSEEELTYEEGLNSDELESDNSVKPHKDFSTYDSSGSESDQEFFTASEQEEDTSNKRTWIPPMG
ncbi:hypothetical protein AYI69_g8570 [Smittium culicis]|uniref:Retrotransposon gag domain-containing protein n=1 Tax=Smittium culicis TaxID=133412 RepID=A0A1R1XIU9_9FUNG|nr:hypothetical protein AYI69_g8570 [Smittium culicis]